MSCKQSCSIYFQLSAEGERTLYKIDKIDSESNYEVEIYARNEIGEEGDKKYGYRYS